MGMTEYLAELAWEKYRLEQQGYTVKSQFGASGGPGSSGPSGTYGDWSNVIVSGPSPARTPVATPPPNVSTVTGIDPGEVSNALYGKPIPLSALGLARIGTAGLIFGPYFNSGAASFAVSFGFPANPQGTRRVYEVSLDSKVAWELAAGSPAGALDPAGFIADTFDCRFYSGTMTQGADPLEAGQFGAEAVAYRPQMMLWFTNLPVAAFNGKVPFVSAKIGDVTDGAVPGDGINLGEALERIGYSPWIEYDASTFETTGVADIVGGMILTEDQSFLDLLRITNRVYRTLDILQTDKLRVSDRGATVTPDVLLQRDHIAAEGGVQYVRREQSSVARELELLTIDPDADYVFMPSKAVRPLAPVPVTAAVSKDSMTLPVVVDASTRAALVTYAKYEEENARKRISLQAMLYGYALEPGDLFTLGGIADGLDPSEVFKVIETSHGANYINEISGEAILKCAIYTDPDVDPFFTDVILLLHANSVAPVVDSSQYNQAMTITGTVTLDTANKKFGAGSFLINTVATDDWVHTVTTLESWWSISPTNTSPYTIELWMRPLEVPSTAHQTLICRNAGFVGRYWHLYIPSNTNEVRFAASSDGASFNQILSSTGASLVAGDWYHVAADKDSTGTIRIYVNGVMRGSVTPPDSHIDTGIASIDVGGTDSATGEITFRGNIDEVRITKRSRYGDVYGNTSFAVPSGPFPDHV